MAKKMGNVINLAFAGISFIAAATLFGIGFEVGRLITERGVRHIEAGGFIPKEYNARTVFIS